MYIFVVSSMLWVFSLLILRRIYISLRENKPWRDCSVQLLHITLERFAAAPLLGLLVRKDDKFNDPTSLNLRLLWRWCRSSSSVPSLTLQLQNLVMHHDKDISLALFLGIKPGSLPVGHQPNWMLTFTVNQINFPLLSSAFFASR